MSRESKTIKIATAQMRSQNMKPKLRHTSQSWILLYGIQFVYRLYCTSMHIWNQAYQNYTRRVCCNIGQVFTRMYI